MRAARSSAPSKRRCPHQGLGLGVSPSSATLAGVPRGSAARVSPRAVRPVRLVSGGCKPLMHRGPMDSIQLSRSPRGHGNRAPARRWLIYPPGRPAIVSPRPNHLRFLRYHRCVNACFGLRGHWVDRCFPQHVFSTHRHFRLEGLPWRYRETTSRTSPASSRRSSAATTRASACCASWRY